MITFRQWRLFWHVPWGASVNRGHPILYSLVYEIPWESAVMTSIRLPGLNDSYGMYSYASWSCAANEFNGVLGFTIIVAGAVDAYGIVHIHEDGVVRSEHARILALRLLPPLKCGHSNAVILDDRAICPIDDSKVRRVTYCPCWNTPSTPKRHHEIALSELERLLLEHYSVPKLPEGVGPWSRSWLI